MELENFGGPGRQTEMKPLSAKEFEIVSVVNVYCCREIFPRNCPPGGSRQDGFAFGGCDVGWGTMLIVFCHEVGYKHAMGAACRAWRTLQ